MDIEPILNLFQTKAFKFLAILAIIGIAISLYSFYHSLHNDRLEKRVMILKELSEIDSKQISNQDILDIYNQTISDLKKDSPDLATNISKNFILEKNEHELTYFYKFLSGGILLLILFIMQTLAYIVAYKKHNYPILFIHYMCLWLIPSIINMLVPLFRNHLINYLFIPSCLSLITLFMYIIYAEALRVFNKLKVSV